MWSRRSSPALMCLQVYFNHAKVLQWNITNKWQKCYFLFSPCCSKNILNCEFRALSSTCSLVHVCPCSLISHQFWQSGLRPCTLAVRPDRWFHSFCLMTRLLRTALAHADWVWSTLCCTCLGGTLYTFNIHLLAPSEIWLQRHGSQKAKYHNRFRQHLTFENMIFFICWIKKMCTFLKVRPCLSILNRSDQYPSLILEFL